MEDLEDMDDVFAMNEPAIQNKGLASKLAQFEAMAEDDDVF